MRAASARPPGAAGGTGVLLGLAAGAAILQVGLAARFEGAKEHLGALALGWAGALFVSALRPRPPQPAPGEAAARGLGALLLALACAASLALRGGYHPAHRLLPLAAGLGLALLAGGPGEPARRGRELLLLALPLLDPLPAALRRSSRPVEATAALAGGYLRTLGWPAQVEGALIRLQDSTLEVIEGCSGLTAMSQLLLLAVLLLCAFPTRASQKLRVVAVAVAVGFAVNAGRVAFLAVIGLEAPDDFAYYDGYGRGALVFPVIATALAGLCWWLILRRPGAAAPGAPPAGPASPRGSAA